MNFFDRRPADEPYVRILVIDDDPRVGQDIAALFPGAQYQIYTVPGTGGALLGKSIEHARRIRPHIAIVDLRLLNEYTDDRSGLTLIRSLISARCVLYSAYLSPDVLSELVERYGDRNIKWVEKDDHPMRLVNTVESAADEWCAFRHGLLIEWPRNWQREQAYRDLFGEEQVPTSIIDDVLIQLFPENEKLTLEPISSAQQASSAISRGNSIVLKAHADQLEPSVLKLVATADIQRETDNFYQHVKGHLVGNYHVQLENQASFWDVGGAVYTFMGSSLESLPPFATFYREEDDPVKILRPLHHFFHNVWRKHYSNGQPLDAPSLYSAYSRFLKLTRRLEDLRTSVDFSLIQARYSNLPNPLEWIENNRALSQIDSAQQAVTHGDLHGDNLFVEGEHAWPIDFERTGTGPILRDFVELEVDILTRLIDLAPDEHGLFYELITALTSVETPANMPKSTPEITNHEETMKAYYVISGLRGIACEVTKFEDIQEYLWGLLCDGLFAAALANLPAQQERALMLSAVICRRLEEITS